MEGTLARTRKHVNYFGKSFCADKTAITLFVLIILITCGIVYTLIMDPKEDTA